MHKVKFLLLSGYSEFEAILNKSLENNLYGSKNKNGGIKNASQGQDKVEVSQCRRALEC